MLDTVIKFSIKHKAIVALLTLVLVVWGVWSALRLPIDAVPDITNNQVQIITVCPTLASQEVEQSVTFPIERSLANIPKVDEIRSISRFGLSVITVVFHEDVDVYFARQLIGERLKEAEEQIPKGIGRPELAPISTGLGEVYQYILHPQKGSEHKYDAKDLRTMQDWIVARQLYGTEGVAEVNSFGGELKQYEVAVNPNRLRALGVSIADIYTALEQNNENTGGAYIDKKPNAYFIRGVGLVTSLEDVKQIAIKSANGSVPVFINDVAEVRYGSALRYGAMSYNGEVDAVGGVVMMLKGANSNEVVNRIKDKIPQIQQSLPEGVVIEPFLDRTDLVGRAMGTVEKNLIEGALIVIFVLVLFLGNLRAGLIVASAIPLALLFALGMMNLFQVSANLMSLGAIDFGLIIDGAVIIVEATLHHLGLRKSVHRLTQQEMDNEVFLSASKIRGSAAFGEIIILIVYIPILTLTGIEGKMFVPMAKTVGFAILGALILSLTYIPMMCALFLSKKPQKKQTFSDRIMQRLQVFYKPLLVKALKLRRIIITIAVLLFAVSIYFFRSLGGEFIPQLQEGDFAFHCILPQGSSLSQSLETSMQASRIVKQFKEVKMVVGKTGSAEVPTDPMPPEATDLVIVLKPKKDWERKISYDELGDEMLQKLSVIPGIFFEKNQPIQMRFNELMTGIRQDVAVKIFGENMDSLRIYADQVSRVIGAVKGATAPQTEQVSGMPQISVTYDRTRLANYGLSVAEVNSVLSAAFAGKVAGQVFENERRFDLVVRLDSTYRRDIEDVRNLVIPTGLGAQIPLTQVADVNYKLGPAQISREDGKRRIVVGFNVSGRDVSGVVSEIQSKLAAQIQLPAGYYFTYGGQFEHLQAGSKRLMVAVPVALLLIFMLLYLTFSSVKQALLIFTAIPMSAIGGIAALLIRGMPFSISAGIGFIALFGVAVLNGIVLIGTFNQLEKEGGNDVLARIIEGAQTRLRPVLMTATVASLGFLPMAISTGAGAEVQKPLATVVIGGLISATLLTLFVLPALYLILSKRGSGNGAVNYRFKGSVLVLLFVCLGFQQSVAQNRYSIAELEKRALNQNLGLEASSENIKAAEWQAKTAYDIPKTGFFVENEDLRPSDNIGILKIGVQQQVAWPGLYKARKHYLEEKGKLLGVGVDNIAIEIKRDLRAAYYQLWYLEEKYRLQQTLDTLYAELEKATKLKVDAGDVAGIEYIAATTKSTEVKALMLQVKQDILVEQQQLMMLLNTEEQILPESNLLPELEFTWIEERTHPMLASLLQSVAVAKANVVLQRNSGLPDFSGRFFTQRLWAAQNPFTGFSVMASVPLLGWHAYKRGIDAAKVQQSAEEKQLLYQQQKLNTQKEKAMALVKKELVLLQFYKNNGLQQSEAILKAATLGYQSGAISYTDLNQYLTQAIALKQSYLETLNQFNQSVIQYHYFINK